MAKRNSDARAFGFKASVDDRGAKLINRSRSAAARRDGVTGVAATRSIGESLIAAPA
jgi:hypothetical protein